LERFLDTLLVDYTTISSLTMVDLVFALASSFIFSFILSIVYIKTHSGYSYSLTYVHALTFVSITVALIMLIIGSNVARAFALVGAMSIVRFRNPVKDSRDLSFIFMAIAIGMACGTRFYGFALIFTLFITIVTLLYSKSGFGLIQSSSYVLRVRMEKTAKDSIERVLRENSDRFFLISLDQHSEAGGTEEIVYEVELDRSVSYSSLVEKICNTAGNVSCSLLIGESNVDA
jgi:uncharacterized membrane protein YhiD involved in acid resistance